MNSDYIVYALIAVGIFTAYMAIVNIFRRDRMRARLQTADGYAFVTDTAERPPSALAGFCEGLLALIGVDVKGQKSLELLLQQAGIYSPNAPVYVVFFKKILQPVIFVIGAFVFINMITATGVPVSRRLMELIIAVLLIVIGLFGANIFISNKKQRRQTILMRSFPEALDLLLVCIESGLGLDAALAKVCYEMKASHPDLSYELERTRAELTLLSDRTQALQNLGERTELIPFKSLVASLIQTEKFGTSLLETLRVLSEDQRVTRLLNAENKAARIPVLITIPLIFCILPSFIIIILGPPIVRVIDKGGIFGQATPRP